MLLALKRGLEPKICAAMGMLHDIWNYGPEFSIEAGPHPDHASLGVAQAEHMLQASDFSAREIAIICGAISRHSNKIDIDGTFDVLLKDADVLQHYLYNPSIKLHWQNNTRLQGIMAEFGLALPSTQPENQLA